MLYCQSCWHIVTADAFHFYAYFASMKDVWILHMLKNSKNWVRIQTAKQLLKMFPGFNQRQFSNIVAGDNTSNEKKWNKSEKLNMVEVVWCQNIISTKNALWCILFLYYDITIHIPLNSKGNMLHFGKRVLEPGFWHVHRSTLRYCSITVIQLSL